MKKYYSLLIGGLLSISTVMAQTQPAEHCGFEKGMQHQLAQDPQLRERLQKVEAQIQRQISRQRQARVAVTAYTIPVVIHVLNKGGAVGAPDNPNDVQIKDAIDGLNKYWGKGFPQSGGADIQIQFALATRAPDCKPTTGINRIDARVVPGFETDGITKDNQAAIKSLSYWSNKDYINIWVAYNLYEGAAGLGTLPGTADKLDGIMILGSYFDSNHRTLAHEMGHLFNLNHTFNGDNDGTNCPPKAIDSSTENDLVDDTEPHIRTSACPDTSTMNVCTGAKYLIVDKTFKYTVLNNYMNYSFDCRYMFTEGQKTRIRATLDVARAGLKNGFGFMTTDLKSLPNTIAVTTNNWKYTDGRVGSCANGVVLSAGQLTFSTYQWQKDAVNIVGATSSTYTPAVSGSYRLVQTVCGQPATTSNAIQVDIYSGPTSVSINSPTTWFCTGSTVSLKAITDDFAYANTYQWYKNNQAIDGATTKEYLAPAEGTYKVTVTRCGQSLTSSDLKLISSPAPSSVSINSPTTRFCPGSTVSLKAITDDFYYANTYQWYKNNQAIDGATTKTYLASAEGTYKVTVTRCGQSLTSSDLQLITPVTACTPTFTNIPGGFYGLGNLTLANINASSSVSMIDGGNYIDRSCAYFGSVSADSTVKFSVQTFNNSYVKLFLDKNNDGNFVELASIVTLGGTISDGAGSFLVPAGTLTNTALRLRVGVSSSAYNSSTVVTACGLNEVISSKYGSGQIEDFSLIVSAPVGVTRTGIATTHTTIANDNAARTGFQPGNEFGDGASARLTVMPNPIVGRSFLISQRGLATAQVLVLDATGRQVRYLREPLTDEMARITLTDPVQVGLYLVQTRQGNSRQTARVILSDQ